MQKNENGFSPMVVVLIVLLIGLVGFAAWKVSQANKDDNQSANSQTAEEQASTEASEATDETENWLLYTSAQATYKVRIPDGWDMETLKDTENLYGGRTVALEYKPGTKAEVTTVEGGWDGASPFSLYVPGAYYDQIVKMGTKQGDVSTKAGLKAEKYVYVQTEEPEGIGYTKDAKVYNYYFGAEGKYIQIEHVVNPGSEDQHEMVEKMLATLQVN